MLKMYYEHKKQRSWSVVREDNQYADILYKSHNIFLLSSLSFDLLYFKTNYESP
jgi:hypothetical protein